MKNSNDGFDFLVSFDDNHPQQTQNVNIIQPIQPQSPQPQTDLGDSLTSQLSSWSNSPTSTSMSNNPRLYYKQQSLQNDNLLDLGEEEEMGFPASAPQHTPVLTKTLNLSLLDLNDDEGSLSAPMTLTATNPVKYGGRHSTAGIDSNGSTQTTLLLPNALNNSNLGRKTSAPNILNSDKFGDLFSFGPTISLNSSPMPESKPQSIQKPAVLTPQPTINKPGCNKPNYNLGGLRVETPLTTTNNTTTAQVLKKPSNTGLSTSFPTFDNLLPQTFLDDIKTRVTPKEDLVEKNETENDNVDPDKVRVKAWTNNKKSNIRALLCSMHTVLWEGAKWTPCGLQQLLTEDDVKKIWKKAVLVVHPDKLVDHPQVNLARLIFVQLNDSWAQFQAEGAKSLY